ncbi:MAG TPA: hypothetical protein VFO58_03800 [Vicinamibacterales bacterium]|nr:hypothetical protein [Vicinamibacterales bacterium]
MSSIKSQLPVAQEPTLFEGAVRDRSWEWLLELRRRLKVELLLVDGRCSVLLPARDQAARLQGLLEQTEPVLVSAINATLRSRTAHVVELGGLQAVCLAISRDRGDAGALLVGRTVPPGQDPRASRDQLQLVTSWLATAVEAHLLSPPSLLSSGLSRVAPLAQVFGQCAEHESDRELVRLFGEAVAVWHDIEVCGYVETSNGGFARDVTLPGANKGERPLSISAEELPEATELTRLPHGHLDRFGLPVSCDVYVSRLARAAERSWLLVFIGAIDDYDLQRLGAYLALLELALALSTSTMTTRVVNTIGSRLSDVQQTPEMRTRNALEELRRTLGASSAGLKIESPDGAPLFDALSPDLADTSRADPGASRLVLVKRSEQHYTTTVSLGRYESRQFTPRDYAVASAAATVFGLWVPATLSTAAGRRERRALPRGFQEVIERSACEAIERGVPVAVVVLLIRDAISLPGSTQRWVAGIRGQMRASDVAGMLTEGEIGLLLHDIANEQAKAIAERLRTVVSGAPGREAILIGVASWTPGQDPADGIVRRARADALADGRRAQVSVSPRGVNS